MDHPNRKVVFQPPFFRGYVKLPGCKRWDEFIPNIATTLTMAQITNPGGMGDRLPISNFDQKLGKFWRPWVSQENTAGAAIFVSAFGNVFFLGEKVRWNWGDIKIFFGGKWLVTAKRVERLYTIVG